MTYSIVAVDREAKEVGFAIASCNWDARRVCRAKGEVGAIASQASGNLSLLPRYFSHLAEGLSLDEVLSRFKQDDAGIESRKIGMVRFGGEALAFTGAKCTPWAGHVIGEDYSCQGNILAGPQALDAMSKTFEASEGMLVMRFYAALAAAEAAGGDDRGKQSVGLAVMKANPEQPGGETLVDFAIADHDDPVTELGRVLQVGETLLRISMMRKAFETADEDGRRGILASIAALLAGKEEPRYADGWSLLANKYHEIGDSEKAAAAFRTYVSICPGMVPNLRRMAEAGDLPASWAAILNSP